MRHLLRLQPVLVDPLVVVEPPAGDQVVPVIDVVFQPLEAQESDAQQRRQRQETAPARCGWPSLA